MSPSPKAGSIVRTHGLSLVQCFCSVTVKCSRGSSGPLYGWEEAAMASLPHNDELSESYRKVQRALIERPQL